MFDHLVFLWRRKWVVLGCGLLSGLVGLVAWNVLTPRADCHLTIRVGRGYDVASLEEPVELGVRLGSPAFAASLTEGHPDLTAAVQSARITALTEDGSQLIRIKVTASNESDAHRLGMLAADRVIREHSRRREQLDQIVRRRIEGLRTTIMGFQKQIKALGQATAAGEPVARVFGETRRSKLLERVWKLEQEVVHLQDQLSPAINPKTAIVDGPTVRVEPLGGKVAVVSLAGGLLLGIILSYVLATTRWERYAETRPEKGGVEAGGPDSQDR